jgi:pimeloyl-ACP methyl ester carboxylesterase
MSRTRLSFAVANGQSIAYREAGDGEALVLLHGFLSDSRCWSHQLAGLADRFRVVAWDAPGAGSSSDPPESFKTADYAYCLASFFDAVAIPSAHVIGLSWGGILAQEFYRFFPKRARSLVLAGTYAGWKGSLAEPVWSERLESCLRDSRGPADELVAKLLPGMFSEGVGERVRRELATIMSDFHPVGLRLMAKSSAEVDTRELLSNIRVPTLLLWGADDRRSPMNIADQFHSGIGDAELVIIPEAGHVSNMEQPEAFNAHVRRFCMEHGAT